MRVGALVETLRASLWFIPTLFVSASVAAAATLNLVRVTDALPLSQLAFPGGAASARAILQVIAGSVITVTGVVFSLTVVMLQLASTQFSPRLLRTFLRGVGNQVVLGTFLATFTYSLVALRGVTSGATPDQDRVPALAITGAYLLAAASVAALVYFVDNIARSIRIDSLMRDVNSDTLKVLEKIHPVADGSDSSPLPPGLPGEGHGATVLAKTSGLVQAISHEGLLRSAAEADVVLRLEVRVGDHVTAGAPIARAWRQTGAFEVTEEVDSAVTRSVQIGYERTMQQDVAFGFRQLVDVAVKALSPGMNDPTTAVHAIGHLTALLTALSRRCPRPAVGRDASGNVRTIVPVMEFPEYLDLSCGQIRRYGAAEPTVMLELLRMLREVARCDLARSHAGAVRREAAMVMAAADRSTPEPRDLSALRELHEQVSAATDP